MVTKRLSSSRSHCSAARSAITWEDCSAPGHYLRRGRTIEGQPPGDRPRPFDDPRHSTRPVKPAGQEARSCLSTNRQWPQLQVKALHPSPCRDRHRTQKIRPCRPQTNGKVERLNRTLADEWDYLWSYTSNDEWTAALADFLHTYTTTAATPRSEATHRSAASTTLRVDTPSAWPTGSSRVVRSSLLRQMAALVHSPTGP